MSDKAGSDVCSEGNEPCSLNDLLNTKWILREGEYEWNRLQIRTLEKYYEERDFKKNGELRKGCEKRQIHLLCCGRGGLRGQIMKAIVVQHNLFINRDNPKELNKTVREVMITELSEIYAIVTSKEQTKSERIKE